MSCPHFKTSFLLPLLCFVLLISGSSTVTAQASRSISLKGSVTDETLHPVAGASVSMLNSANHQLILQTVTDSEGHYSFNGKAGSIEVVVSYIGYTLYRSKVTMWSSDRVLEVIHISPDHQKLNEVVIKGQNNQPLIQANDGKIIYNVANSVNAQGSNILEVLKRAPGIIVGSDNTINIAGRQGALVMLNGKQTYMQTAELADLLKSMPSSNVKSIEVIGNPSAKYDASGSGGIINIVLKKNENEGLNATVNAGLSYGLSVKQNTELSFNYRKDKINVFATYNQTIGHHGYRYGTDREQSGTVYSGWSHDTDKRNTIGSSTGLDYKINDKQTVGVLLNGNFLFGGGFISTLTTIKDQQTGLLRNTLLSESDYYYQKANRYSGNLNYQYEDTLGRTLHIDVDYGNFDAGAANLQPNTYFDADGKISSAYTNRTQSGRGIDLYAFSAGYQSKLWKGKLDAGIKYSSVSARNSFDFYDVNGSNDVRDDQHSNTFDFKERIASSYAQYDRPFNEQLSFQAGLRLEQTTATGTLFSAQNGSLGNRINRNYLNAFPSIGLMMKLKDNKTLSLNYGRRIDRPAYQDLNPIEQPLDGLTFIKGNPYLLPQTTQRISIQYGVKKTIIDLSYSHTSNYSASISDTADINKVVLQSRNLGTQQQAGLNVIQQFSPLKIWDISVNASVYYLRNQISFDENRRFDLERIAGSLNVQQTLTLPFHVKAEVAAIFNTKRLGGANDISQRNSQIDIGFQRSLLQNKAKLRLAFTDIFLGNKWDSTSYFNGYYIRNHGYGESRMAKLNFTYNFGNMKVKAPKQKESGLKSETQRL